MRRFHSDITLSDAQAVADAVPEYPLSDFRLARLYYRLCQLRNTYDFRRFDWKAPSLAATRSDLSALRGAIKRVALFGSNLERDGSGSAVVEMLAEAGRECVRSDIASGAKVPTVVGVNVIEDGGNQHLEYATDVTITQFFKLAQVLDKWVRVADGAENWSRTAESRLSRQKEAPPEVWLIGAQLPELYERTFGGKRFGLSRSTDQELTGPSVKFVVAALTAMKIGSGKNAPWAPETVANYRTKAVNLGLVQARKK